MEDDRIYLPAGKGKVAFIDLRDMGVVAADVLTDMGRHAGETYTLTGTAAYTFYEVADILTGALGRAIRYDAASIIGYYRHLRRRGVARGRDLHPDDFACRPPFRTGRDHRPHARVASGIPAPRRGTILTRPRRFVGEGSAGRRGVGDGMRYFHLYEAMHT